MVEITLPIDGREVTMESCSTCDHRIWHHRGKRLDFGGVLGDLGLGADDDAESVGS
jgi:hypothetical protein